MVIKFESNVNATISYLKLLKVKVNNSTVDDTLQNHPDWPSLLCISDSLNTWNVPNAAGKIEVTEIDQLPTPFMAYTNNVENSLEIVTEVSEKEIIVYSAKQNKQIIESKESFLKRWKGIYLIAEKIEKSGEKDFELNKNKAFVRSLIPISLFILLTIISFIFLIRNLGSSKIESDFLIYLQYVILMIGVFVTTLLLWYEIDRDNPLLHKVCTGIAKGNCDAILSSKQSKVLSWLSWSEVGFFYFAVGLITLLFATPLNNSISIIGYLNILALPYTIFSIYYQSVVAKQWCVLCLSVQALLVLGGINIIVNRLLLPILQIPIDFLFKSILFYLLPVIGWYAIKPYLLRLQEAKNTKREYLRIKFNSEIFETLLKKQKQITFPTDGIGIDFGNPEATNTLVKVCNPYCGPCSKAHPKIEKLLEEIPNLKVKVIFTTPNDPNHDAFKPINYLLAIRDQNKSDEIIKHAMDDWYLAEKKDYERFASKYPINGKLEKQGNKINAMFKWCNNMEINFTPTIFINGYQLPEPYNIEDLQYFLLE
ncbi:MAG: thioredoxin domain-containing protein [Bacteroidota bacterium]|nr:thioredoxin domain-containing protein [Bacteroidota bacterium]